MGRKFNFLFAVVLIGIAFCSISTIGYAQESVSTGDRDFVTAAAHANNGEIVLAKLALQKTSSPAIRMFAQRMITDHSKAGEQLTAVATSTKAVTMPQPDSLTPEDQQTHQTLSGLSGHPFDVAYIKSQIADHEAAVSLFQKEAKSGSNPSIMQFASSTLPTLQEHLKLAQQTQDNVGS